MAASASSSSSSRTYHVYLSFRGEETHLSYIHPLCKALKQRGIRVFMNEAMEKGENIAESLLQSIEASQIALVIFSQNYASSKWCLHEVVKIMECKRSQALVVMPIFYKVDPSDVRFQRGKYRKAMEDYEQAGTGRDKLFWWRKALTEISDLPGFSHEHSVDSGSASEQLEEIVEKVLSLVREHPMRIESQIHEPKVDKWFHYDVFLSFRGKDTRHGFTSTLYRALRRSGIHAFMDDSGLERGEEVSASLMQAIERSQINLVIFSPDYASSSWCLDELVKIMECRRSLAQVAIPIFYGVESSDVRHQRGAYGKAMKRHEERLGSENDEVMRWREALRAAANISGFVFSW
ncbi:TMV resistance protein N-like [Neltuma alba]|uniref:TMV resistance protein N-like n=1 Tax=Neltuma alba TaxID=207710 RepID=UPI0010A351F6|nr:TMV resistance protein N-like [Prosopis alba]